MRKIERHEIPMLYHELIRRDQYERGFNFLSSEDLDKIFIGVDGGPESYRMDSCIKDFHEKFVYGSILEKPKEEIFRYLACSADFGLYHFLKRLTPKGEPYTTVIAGHKTSSVGAGVIEYVDTSVWQMSWQDAVITKKWDSVALLSQVKEEVFRSATAQGFPLEYKLVAFYKSLFSKDQNLIVKTFKEAFEYTDVEKYPTKYESYTEKTLFVKAPLLEVYLGIITKDEAFYNEKLYKGLELYRQFVEQGFEFDDVPRTGINTYFIAFPYLAAIRIAQLNGLKTEVASEYIPQWLVEGDFEGLPLDVLD